MMTTSDAFRVALADGTGLTCNKTVPKCVIDFGRSKSKHPFKDTRDLHVLDLNNTFDVILGMPFLESRNPSIDWKKRTLTFKNVHKGSRNEVDSCDTVCPHTESMAISQFSSEIRVISRFWVRYTRISKKT